MRVPKILFLSLSLLGPSVDGHAQTVTANFSLCDSTLLGFAFDCLQTPHDKDGLTYDKSTNKWVPKNVNGLIYKGTFDASPGTAPVVAASAGDYFVISVPGTINSDPYVVGDWIAYNGTEWQRISNPKNVLSMFNRTGHISAKEGDYSLDHMSDVDLSVSPSTGDVLSYVGGKWIPVSLSSITPSGSAGGSFTGTFPNPTLAPTGVTAGTYTSVSVNTEGLVTSASKPTTFAGYGITDVILASFSATAPFSLGGTSSAPSLSMSQASAGADGYLSSTDWSTFNNKQDSLATGATINGIVYPANISQTIQVPLAPVNLTDAANKSYVDSNNSSWTLSTGNVYRASGSVGIDTSSTTAALQIGNGTSTDGLIVARGYGTVGTNGITLPVSGTGTRMFWYPKKAAFRAGRALGTSWDDANIGLYSAAFGYGTKASGNYSFAIGESSTSSGLYSVAFGKNTTASGSSSFTSGTSNTASGTSSTAMGNTSTASGAYSAAIGYQNIASGNTSMAFGALTKASGDYSATFGYGTSSPAYGQITFGAFNKTTGAENATTRVLTDPVFVVGNGTSSLATSNALVVLKNGNIGLGVNAPASKLQVAGDIAPDADGTRDLGTAALKFQNIYATNGVIQTSDRRLKKDIRASDLGLRFINSLNPVSYYWKDGDERRHYGLVAQEVAKALQGKKTGIVHYDEKADLYGVRYTELISPLIKAIQELYQKVSAREAQDRSLASITSQTKTELETLHQKTERLEQETDELIELICAENKSAQDCEVK